MTTTATATAATVPQSMAIIGGGGGGGSATANTADNTSATAGSKLFVYGGVDIRDEFEEVSSTVDPKVRERDRLPLQMRLKTANTAHGVYSSSATTTISVPFMHNVRCAMESVTFKCVRSTHTKTRRPSSYCHSYCHSVAPDSIGRCSLPYIPGSGAKPGEQINMCAKKEHR